MPIKSSQLAHTTQSPSLVYSVGPLLAVLGFVLGAGVHREGFLKLVSAREGAAPLEPGMRKADLESHPEAHLAGRSPTATRARSSTLSIG